MIHPVAIIVTPTTFRHRTNPNNSNTSHKQPKTLNKVLNKYINKDLNKGENKYLNKESGSSVKSTPETYKGVPVAQISNLYHKILSELPPISYWSKKRLHLLHQRWSEDPDRQNLNFWQNFFEKVRTSDFLMGKVKGKARNWRCNIDWLLDEEHFLKVCEGFYKNKDSPADLLTSKTSKNWEVLQMFEEALDMIERGTDEGESTNW